MSAPFPDDGVCALCGDTNARRNRVCNGCGARLPWADDEEAAARAAKIDAAQPAAQPTAQNAEKKSADNDSFASAPRDDQTLNAETLRLNSKKFDFQAPLSVWLLRLWALCATTVLFRGIIAQDWLGEYFWQMPVPYIAFLVVMWRLYLRCLCRRCFSVRFSRRPTRFGDRCPISSARRWKS